MLIDKVRVNFRGGLGGSGSVHFHKSGKPEGGDGGHGGSVYLVGDENIHDLRAFNSDKKYYAEDGQRGAFNKRTGANGENLYVKVPLTTKVYDLAGRLLTKVSEHGQKELIARGGRGGRGNYYFRKGQLETLKKFTPGIPGEKIQVFLDLELKADIIFIGLPNAGKSSMLNALTSSKAKVADYPFTTLVPYLGVREGIKFMDLPGLIEGTSTGKGLGSNFTKHAKNARLIAHFISLDSEDLKKDYSLIRKELELIDESLSKKPEILVLTKTDNYDKIKLEQKTSEVRKFHKNYVTVSIIDDESISKLFELVKKAL